MGFGSWLGKHIFKPAGKFLGKAVKGIATAGKWLGHHALPVLRFGTGVIRDVASNPLAQMAASAVLGPEAGLALGAISAGAGFANNLTRAAPNIVNGFRTPQGAQRSVADLAQLQQQYRSLRR